MLLLITGSSDGTSNLLAGKLGTKVFRFNYDLFLDYSLEFTTDYWEIINPAGHSISSKTVTSAFWWKAFNFYLLDQEEFIVEEVKYIFREIYHWCRLRGLVKGIPHDFHNHMGKINILSVAKNYFKIPQTLITFNLAGIGSLNHNEVVAKSLTSGLTTTNKVLFTTQVEKSNLHPSYPWYLQELIQSDADITIFICGTKLFAFQRSRLALKGLDWRCEQDFYATESEWLTFDLSEQDRSAVRNFTKHLGIDWGRIDLMKSGGSLVFLEFNANGQWVFLDYENKYGLVDAVIDYLTLR